MKAIVEGKEVDLTNWFPPEVKPVRPGWYQSGWSDFSHIPPPNDLPRDNLYFDGTYWRVSPNGHITLLQNRWWRGLAKPWGES